MSDLDMKPISDLFLRCSFRVRNLHSQVSTMSDSCCQHATSGVKDLQGNVFWRCDNHSGKVDTKTRGDIITSIPKTWNSAQW